MSEIPNDVNVGWKEQDSSNGVKYRVKATDYDIEEASYEGDAPSASGPSFNSVAVNRAVGTEGGPEPGRAGADVHIVLQPEKGPLVLGLQLRAHDCCPGHVRFSVCRPGVRHVFSPHLPELGLPHCRVQLQFTHHCSNLWKLRRTRGFSFGVRQHSLVESHALGFRRGRGLRIHRRVSLDTF